MFISSKRTFEFTNDSGETVKIPVGYLGPIPEWAAKTPFFRLAVEDTSITYVGEKGKAIDEELLELRERAVELGIPRAAQMGRDKLRAAIEEKESGVKLPGGAEGEKYDMPQES